MIKLSEAELEYLSKNLEKFPVYMDILDLSRDLGMRPEIGATSIRPMLDALDAALMTEGFDWDYEPTPEGEIIEGLIDKLAALQNGDA